MEKGKQELREKREREKKGYRRRPYPLMGDILPEGKKTKELGISSLGLGWSPGAVKGTSKASLSSLNPRAALSHFPAVRFWTQILSLGDGSFCK